MASFRETVNITLLVMDSTWSEQNLVANKHINSNSRFLSLRGLSFHNLSLLNKMYVCVRGRVGREEEGGVLLQYNVQCVI